MQEHPLRKWRKERGLSGEMLGRLLDTGKSTVSAVENCHKEPTPRLMRKIRRLTRISADQLLDAVRHEQAGS